MLYQLSIKNSSSNALSFCFFFFLLKIVKLLPLISPGAGKVLAPALLACLGRDPQRFCSVAEARVLMGTAPVTKASGSFRVVRFRRGCWKFARRTLQLFAEQSRHQCYWAQAFYEKQRNSGHKHHAALRALAHRRLKILLAMRQSGSLYDEDIFLNSQRRYLLKIPMLKN